MDKTDFILIVQSEIFDYEEFSNLPIDRIELFRELVYPRMIYYKGGFHSHLDILNKLNYGVFYSGADYSQRRNMFNIWNLPGYNGLRLSGYLRQSGISTKVINNFNSGFDLFREYYESCDIKPLVGISTTFYLSYLPVRKMIVKLREEFPRIEIVLGGAFVNEQFINHGVETFEKAMIKNEIDYIIHSFNSETDLKQLILTLKNRTSYEHVNNLCYFENTTAGKVFRHTSTVWNSPDLKPLQDIKTISDLSYIDNIIQIRTSSGCPYNCSFCSYPEIAGKDISMDDDDVAKTLQTISKNENINKIIFIDDTINTNKQKFKTLCKLLSEYNFAWFAFLRVNTIDEETAILMKESGCAGLFLGLESSNGKILKIMNKKAKVSQYINGINLLKKYNILTMGAFIIGFPGDTEKTVEETIDFINNSGLDFYKLEEFYYLHHTPIHKNSEKYNLTGEGNNWRHETMDYKTASVLKLKVFEEVTKSTYIDSDTSLWSIAYLYSRGFSFDRIKKIQTELNKIVLDQLGGTYDDMHPSYQAIKQLLKVSTGL